jgi:catechol 1,2-dioxygenase
MTVSITSTPQVLEFLKDSAQLKNKAGSARNKQIVFRLLQETTRLIEEPGRQR